MPWQLLPPLPQASPRAQTDTSLSVLVEDLDLEDPLAIRSLLRLLRQSHQPGLLMATQSTTASIKIGTVISPQVAGNMYLEELKWIAAFSIFKLHLGQEV